VAAYGATWAWRRGRGQVAAWSLGVGAALFCGVVFLGMLPQAAAVIQTPAKDLARELERRVDSGQKVLTYGLWKPSLIFYTERNLPRLKVDQGAELAQALATSSPVYVLSRTRLKDKLLERPGFVVLQTRGGYLLGGNPAAAASWRGEAPPPVDSKEPA